MGTGKRDFFKLGDHNAICYVCGFKRKASEMRLRWDNVYVCKEDWEIRHPQDFIRGLPEEMTPEWTQPEPPDTFQGTPTNPLANIVVGTPSIFVNGVLQTSGVDYTITLPQGTFVMTVPPAQGLTIAWSGVWLDGANVQTTYTQFPLYVANGYTTAYAIYGVK